jgi:hypothetical protein
LRTHWSPPFVIGAFVSPDDGDEIWSASAAGETLTARSSAALRPKIRKFYDEHDELHQRR